MLANSLDDHNDVDCNKNPVQKRDMSSSCTPYLGVLHVPQALQLLALAQRGRVSGQPGGWYRSRWRVGAQELAILQRQ
jgi:hypothetical protein